MNPKQTKMPTHYQVLGIGMEATTDEVKSAYRKAASEVLPKHNLFPTSVLAIDKFRVVQDAYECLINPKTREEYDSNLRELAAEEQSLFGERKARRRSKDEEEHNKRKTPPPYVWNEDTNAPLFWTPGRKMIEGPESDSKATPVAYFRRSSLDKQVVKVPDATPAPMQKPAAVAPSPPNHRHRRTQSSPSNALVLRVPTAQETAKVGSAFPSPSPYSSPYHYEQQPQHLQGWRYSVVAAEYLAQQKAQIQAMDAVHRQQVEIERAKMAHNLEWRKREIEMERQQRALVEQEVRRRLAEKEAELAARYAERIRIEEAMKEQERQRMREEMEKENEWQRMKAEKKMKRASAKQVRWGLPVGDGEFDGGFDGGFNGGFDGGFDEGFDGAPVVEYKAPETGPYGSGWWSEPELPPVRHHNVLKKRRVFK